MQHHNAMSTTNKGRESEMEGGLTNGFAMKKTNSKYRDLNFLHWKALSNHLATDMDFPQRVSAYRANSCYANGAENNVLKMEHYLLQGSTRFLIPCVHINIKAMEPSVLWAHHLDFFLFFLQGVLHWKIQLFPGWSQSCQQVIKVQQAIEADLLYDINTIIACCCWLVLHFLCGMHFYGSLAKLHFHCSNSSWEMFNLLKLGT